MFVPKPCVLQNCAIRICTSSSALLFSESGLLLVLVQNRGHKQIGLDGFRKTDWSRRKKYPALLLFYFLNQQSYNLFSFCFQKHQFFSQCSQTHHFFSLFRVFFSLFSVTNKEYNQKKIKYSHRNIECSH
jgi:hypothetical protein